MDQQTAAGQSGRCGYFLFKIQYQVIQFLFGHPFFGIEHVKLISQFDQSIVAASG